MGNGAPPRSSPSARNGEPERPASLKEVHPVVVPIHVCKAKDLPPGENYLLKAPDGRDILIIHTADGQLTAMDNACYHHGLSLRNSKLEMVGGRRCMKCPWHGYLLELETGEGIYVGLGADLKTKEVRSKGPKQRTYKVEVQDGSVVLMFDLSGEFASDEYADMALANNEQTGPSVPSSDAAASDVRSGKVLAQSRPKSRPSSSGSPKTMKAACLQVTQETTGVKSFTFEVRGTGGEGLPHVAGQHAVFEIPALGPRAPLITRSWTISSAPDHNSSRFTLTIKQQPGGLASVWMHNNIRRGVQLDMTSVGGSFALSFPNAALKETNGMVLMLAAGIGITPFMSMLRDLFSGRSGIPRPNGLNFDIQLIYSEKSIEDFVFFKELQTYATSDSAAGGHHLHVHFTITQTQPPVWGGFLGRINFTMIQNVVPDFQQRTIMLCGPQVFMDTLQQQLTEAGVPASHILRETFT